MSGLATAATRTWTNLVGGVWSVSNNWDGLVPTYNDAVILPDAATSQTRTVDVRGVTYHASVGANLPAGGTTGGNAQMYWVVSDYPLLDWSYVNYADWLATPGAYGLVPTTDVRWRGNPNDTWRTLDVSEGDYADFLGKYHPGNGNNSNIYGERTRTENAVPTPMASFSMADISGLGTPKLYIAHDIANAAQRPGWITNHFAATGQQLYTWGGLTWDVFERTVTSNTPAIGDSTGWISHGGRLASLNIAQSTASATQTVALAHDLALTTVPAFNVTAGHVIIDISNHWLQTSHYIVIPSNVVFRLDGGHLGKLMGDTSGDTVVASSVLTIQRGGMLSGTGTVNPGRGNVTIEAGGTLDVGDGVLTLNFPHGESFRWRGDIRGNGTSSILNLANSAQNNGQLKGIEEMSANVDASIAGIQTLQLYPNYADMTFGRFADPDKIDLRTTTLDLRNQTFLWEAQVTTRDVVSQPASTPFKLGAYYAGAGKLKLSNTGPDADAFVYIGQLQNLASGRRIDLNDIALLTDMSQAQLNAVLAFIDNSGAQGAPAVKSVKMQAAGTMWYLAPAGVEIPAPPPLGTTLLVR